MSKMSFDEFMAWEETQTEKHELINGELIVARAGAEDQHVTVCGNVYIALRQHLRDTPCRTFMTDMKLRVEATGSFFYPDVLVTCSAADQASRQVKLEPTLLVEVLSPSTALFDVGGKFAHDRQIPSLREYLVIDTEARRADTYRKGDDGLWVLHPSEPGEPVRLASVGLAIEAAMLWAEVD